MGRRHADDAAGQEGFAESSTWCPFSEARANLGQLVERVAYSDGPVLIAKHERARVAVVPLDMLARDEARFRAAAERALTRREAARQPASDDLDFEDVPGLGEADLAAERAKIDLSLVTRTCATGAQQAAEFTGVRAWG